MSYTFARIAFNAAVAATNGVHMTKRGVVKTAKVAADTAVAGATTTSNAAVAFWAGLKYANQVNKQEGHTADFVSKELADSTASTDQAPKVRKARKPRATKAAA